MTLLTPVMPGSLLERPLLARLRDLVLDVEILQRQLTLATSGDTPSAPLAAMSARAITARLYEAREILDRRAVETAAVAAFRRAVDPAANTSDPARMATVGGRLFLAAALQVLEAVAPRHQPEIDAAYDWPSPAAAPLALTA